MIYYLYLLRRRLLPFTFLFFKPISCRYYSFRRSFGPGLYQNWGLNEFLLRLPGALILLISCTIFYFLSRRLFGSTALASFYVVLGSSLLVINSSKLAVADSFLFAVQLVSIPLLIRYLKQGKWQWQLGWWSCLIIGSLLAPLVMLIWGVAWWQYLRMLHPNGQRLKEWYWLFLWVAGVSIGWTKGWLDSTDEAYFLAYTNQSWLSFLGISMLGILPWLGFLPAALRELFFKLKKKEELALLTSAWLLIGLLSHSLIFQAALAFCHWQTIASFSTQSLSVRQFG